eukprot:CAMPEP_0197580254 /NCGR_PEP_ID=MMETSP1326-20131121/4088_1 /TAXON_ID=1155430 /ORGANISM="Genus nov. species nov., Strain RCC2288" /LENGTH=692 /DNA_ID=CAMNT_0043143955 /DNA_START=95 /DNA_END=2173 /DNA_ORIENTATION=-
MMTTIMQLHGSNGGASASVAVARRSAWSGVRPTRALVDNTASSSSSRGRRHLPGRAVRCAAGDASDGAGESDGGDAKKPDGTNTQGGSNSSNSSNSNSGGTSGGEEEVTLESEFMRIVRERQMGAARALATRWKRGGLRPRVVHESPSEWIRKAALCWPYAAFGTASGAVIVSNCEELGGLEYRAPGAQKLFASAFDAHSTKWADSEGRGSNMVERGLLGLYKDGAVTALAMTDDIVVSGGRDGYVRVWRLPVPVDGDQFAGALTNQGIPLGRVGSGVHPGVVTGIALDPATRSLWTSCLDGCVRRWVLTPGPSGERLRLAGRWSTGGQPALCVALCAQDRVVYVGTADGSAMAFDAGAMAAAEEDGAEGAEAGTGSAGSGSELGMRMRSSRSSDGDYVDAGGGDGNDDGLRGELCKWQAHDGLAATRSIAASPGGCITGSGAGPVLAWRFSGADQPRPPPPQLVSKLLGHAAAVVSISTGNPKHLVTAAHDGTVRVWDMPKLVPKQAESSTSSREGDELAGLIDDIFSEAFGSGDGEEKKEGGDAGDRGGSSGSGGSSSGGGSASGRASASAIGSSGNGSSSSSSGDSGGGRASSSGGGGGSGKDADDVGPQPYRGRGSGSSSSSSSSSGGGGGGGGAKEPFVERQEALYAVTGHSAWLSAVQSDDTHILCDGAHNIAMLYDFAATSDEGV